MVLQAFIDDSYETGDRGAFVLGGYVAKVASWVKFSQEWEASLVHWGWPNKRGNLHFKMAEAAAMGRWENAAVLYRHIEDHVEMALSCGFLKEDLIAAKKRIWSPIIKTDWGFMNNYYRFAFRCLMDMFHTHRTGDMKSVVPISEKVDFYFDAQDGEDHKVHEMWQQYMDGRSDDVRQYYGNRPMFRHDDEFVELQSADFWAWWVRKWLVEGDFERKMTDLDFEYWRPCREKMPRLHIRFSEDQITEFAIQHARRQKPGFEIVDLKGKF